MNYEYDIAISFAGENRNTADEIAAKLKANKVTIFYDRYEEANLFGEDLYERLHEVYSAKARFCIMIISHFYAEKVWTTHERKSAQERALKEKGVYILPVRLDNTPVPGLRETVAYVDLRTKTIDELIAIVMEKLNKDSKTLSQIQKSVYTQPFTIPLPKIKKHFTERDKDLFYEESFDFIKNYFKQAMQELNKVSGLEAVFKEMSSNRFTCLIYLSGNRVAACTIWMGSSNFSRENSIGYANQANQESSNSLNESLSISGGDEGLTFKALMNIFSAQKSENLSATEAAEYLWNKLIEPLNKRS